MVKFKKVFSVLAIAGTLTMAMVSMAMAGDGDPYYNMLLDYSMGDPYAYSQYAMEKTNTSDALVRSNHSDYDFYASVCGYAGYIDEDVNSNTEYVPANYYDGIRIRNFVYENGYRQAKLKGESNKDTIYRVFGYWDADAN